MNHLTNFITCITFYSIAALTLTGCGQPPAAEIATPEQRTLQVFKIESLNASTIKHFNGTVYAHEQAGLSFRVPGTIEELLVEQGANVTKGQLIARLDPHDYQITLEELQAKKLEAQSAHKLAKAELARIKQATDDNAIASVNLDRAISGYERSLSATKVVDKNIQRAKDMLKYTSLYAPFNGVISHVAFEQYEQAIPGVAVVVLQDNTKLEVEVDVPENLIGQFDIGQKSIISWHGSTQVFEALVSEIAPTPHLIKQTYTVTYTIDNFNDDLFPGKAVTLTTQIGTPNNAYCMPYSAIVERQNNMFINIIKNKKVVSTPVEVKSFKPHQACIKGAVNSGDLVVVSGSHHLNDGDQANHLITRKL